MCGENIDIFLLTVHDQQARQEETREETDHKKYDAPYILWNRLICPLRFLFILLCCFAEKVTFRHFPHVFSFICYIFVEMMESRGEWDTIIYLNIYLFYIKSGVCLFLFSSVNRMWTLKKKKIHERQELSGRVKWNANQEEPCRWVGGVVPC